MGAVADPGSVHDNHPAVMVEREIAGHRVRMYDSIDELPIARFHKWQKLLLVDSGVGSDIAAFDHHCEKMRRYMAQGKADLATAEMQNLRQCVYLIQNETELKHRSLAVLVAAIDGKPVDDISDAGLDAVLAKLAGATVGEMTGALAMVKKKLTRN